MRGVHVEKKATVTLSLTADQWDIYSHMPGARDAAMKLNNAVETAINESDSAKEARVKIEPTFKELDEFGTRDGECLYTLDCILDAAYGKEGRQ
jgi:hypothetical protein